MEYAIDIHETSAQPIVSIRERHGTEQIPAFLGRTIGTLFGRLSELGEPPAGPPFVIYHEFGADSIDAEVCVPVSTLVGGGRGVESRELPAGSVVRTTHVGPYGELGGAYDALTSWIDMHESKAAGPVRERYLNGPGDGVQPDGYVTEIEVPIVVEGVPV